MAIKKCIYTLNINGYAPEITALTFPLMTHFAEKIRADFHVISERKFPDWPITYEKLQIFELAREHKNDWNWFFDADALISPEQFDVTEHLKKDTVCHNGRDMAGIRWKYDEYFRRDGRHFGSCNWCTIASDWCLDLWRPLDDITLEQALSNINITIGEHNSGFCQTEHLIDDYTLSRNIARFGLKATTLTDIGGQLGWRMPDGRGSSPFLWHKYTISNQQKVEEMLAVLTTPNGDPAFAEKGELIRDAFGNLRMKMPDGRIVNQAGMGLGLMTEAEAAAYKEQWAKKA